MSSCRLFLLVLGVLSCALIALPVSPSVAGEDSLPRDPSNVYGQYDNGVKYIVRKNASPPGRVSVWLHVKSGSINETDRQNGIAHFLEHMAFNGSKHFKPGELIPLMNHLGMVFGADSNAHTTLHETVYKFNLPDTKPETINTGMTILADVADGLLLADTELDAERKVILEELRGGKGAGERLRKKVFAALLPGSAVSVHDVGGDEEQIKTFPRSEFLDYWNTWYRPELMTLIVVGDIDPDAMIKLGREKLGSFTARAPSRTPNKFGLTPWSAPRALIVTDPEQTVAEVSLTALLRGRPPVTTYAELRREKVENLAEWIVRRRYTDLVNRGDAPFRSASATADSMFHEAVMVNAEAKGEPRDWNKMLDALIAELSRAIDHGFTRRELELARSDALADAERAVQTEPTRGTQHIAEVLSGSTGMERPILSAEQRLELTRRALDSIDLPELHRVFRDNFKLENYAYVLTMPEKPDGVTLPGEDDVLAAARAAWQKRTEAPAQGEVAGTLLPAEPDPGQVVKQEADTDLQVTTAEFANGVVMHHKFSDYKKDSVLIRITLPGGRIEETAANRGISELAGIVLQHPATGRLTSTQIRDAMTGKNVTLRGAIGADTLAINVSGSKRDLATGMQLAYALLTDPVLEQSAVDEWAKVRTQMIQTMRKSPEGQLADAMANLRFAGDARFRPLLEEDVSRLASQRVAAETFYKRITGSAAVEVTVVGDVQLDDALNLVARYVGSLPKRTGTFDTLDTLRKVERSRGPHETVVRFDSITPKSLVMAGFFSCDELDPERRPLRLVEAVLTDRMNTRIREKEQLVYSIGCQNMPGSGIPGTGLFFAASITDPHNAAKLADIINEMVRDFARTGPTDDELSVAKKQVMQTLEAGMKEPNWWLSQIADSRYRARPLAEIKQLPQVFETFTGEQLRAAVAKYATDDGMFSVQIVPESAQSPATQPATAK